MTLTLHVSLSNLLILSLDVIILCFRSTLTFIDAKIDAVAWFRWSSFRFVSFIIIIIINNRSYSFVLLFILFTCSKLQRIFLIGINLITGQCLEKVPLLLPYLTYLNVQHCPKVSQLMLLEYCQMRIFRRILCALKLAVVCRDELTWILHTGCIIIIIIIIIIRLLTHF